MSGTAAYELTNINNDDQQMDPMAKCYEHIFLLFNARGYDWKVTLYYIILFLIAFLASDRTSYVNFMLPHVYCYFLCMSRWHRVALIAILHVNCMLPHVNKTIASPCAELDRSALDMSVTAAYELTNINNDDQQMDPMAKCYEHIFLLFNARGYDWKVTLYYIILSLIAFLASDRTSMSILCFHMFTAISCVRVVDIE
jgi:type IV secretory pathway VirB2 component (pilin)